MSNPQVVLVVCDGLGLSPERRGNALIHASTPTLDGLLSRYPSFSLQSAGAVVGLNEGEPGNSEVGHLALGTGQVIPQAFEVLNRAIASGDFDSNPALVSALEDCSRHNRTLHVIGLVSKGGVHGHSDHIGATLRLAKKAGVARVRLHAITDGRDTPPRTAREDIKSLQPLLDGFADGAIASVSGRFWAMDRDENWPRTDETVFAIEGSSQNHAADWKEAVEAGYRRGESDETLKPAIVVHRDGQPIGRLENNDCVIFTNHRPDRMRQLVTRVAGLSVVLRVVTLTDYFLGKPPPVGRPESSLLAAFSLPRAEGTLADVIAASRKTQLHVAETEKYAHVTYFFNGHNETKHAGEQWMLIPSLKIDSFDRAPGMSASAIAKAAIEYITSHNVDFTLVNFANADMVGHTGRFDAAVEAVECVDNQLRHFVELAQSRGAWLVITADHGNAEQCVDPLTGKTSKDHTVNPVMCVIVHESVRVQSATTKLSLSDSAPSAMLTDIAPTILDIFGLAPSSRMVGASLLARIAP